MRTSGWIASLVLASALLAAPETQEAREARGPVPDAVAVKDAVRSVSEVYRDETVEARTPEQMAFLARRVLQAGIDTANDPAIRFVLCRTARDLAVKAGETALALKAIDTLNRFYQIDLTAMRVETLNHLLPTVESRQALVDQITALIDRALEEDSYDAARQYGEVAATAARLSQDSALLRQAETRLLEIRDAAVAYAKTKKALATLIDDPDNPDANRIAGTYDCFIKGDWDKGLPRLSRVDDQVIRSAAMLELSKPADPVKQAELGDVWWDLADKQIGSAQARLRSHAGLWYRQAVDKLEGYQKTKVAKRLAYLERAARGGASSQPAPSLLGGKIVRYRFDDDKAIRRDWELHGPWQMEKGGLRLFGGGGTAQSRAKYAGNLKVHVDCAAAGPLRIEAWNESYDLAQPAKSVSFIRKGGQITVSVDGQPPRTLEIQEANRLAETPLAVVCSPGGDSKQSVVIRAIQIEAVGKD